MPQLTLSAPNFRRHLSSAFLYFNKLSFGKTFICKIKRLNVKQHRSRWDGSLSRLIWIYAVCKSLLLSPVAVKEFRSTSTAKEGRQGTMTKQTFHMQPPTHKQRRTAAEEPPWNVSREKLLGAGVGEGLQSVLLARTLKDRITTTVDEILKYVVVVVVCCYFVFVVVFVMFSDRIRLDWSVKYYLNTNIN